MLGAGLLDRHRVVAQALECLTIDLLLRALELEQPLLERLDGGEQCVAAAERLADPRQQQWHRGRHRRQIGQPLELARQQQAADHQRDGSHEPPRRWAGEQRSCRPQRVGHGLDDRGRAAAAEHDRVPQLARGRDAERALDLRDRSLELGVAAEDLDLIGERALAGRLLAAAHVEPRLRQLERLLGIVAAVLGIVEAVQQALPLALLEAGLVDHVGVQPIEDVRHQARPQIDLDVVPRVELDLHHVADVGRWRHVVALTTTARGSRELLDPLPQASHEVALAGAPLTEEPDRQRRIDALGRDQARERVDLEREAEHVGAVEAVAAEARHARGDDHRMLRRGRSPELVGVARGLGSAGERDADVGELLDDVAALDREHAGQQIATADDLVATVRGVPCRVDQCECGVGRQRRNALAGDVARRALLRELASM